MLVDLQQIIQTNTFVYFITTYSVIMSDSVKMKIVHATCKDQHSLNEKCYGFWGHHTFMHLFK